MLSYSNKLIVSPTFVFEWTLRISYSVRLSLFILDVHIDKIDNFYSFPPRTVMKKKYTTFRSIKQNKH
jgi:hypothetical protein